MLKVFSNYQGVIHDEFIPEGQNDNTELYLEIIKWLWDAVRWKQPEKCTTKNFFLLNSMFRHMALLLWKITLPDSSETSFFSTDLASVDFYLFFWLKMNLKGHYFRDSDEVIKNAMKLLADVSKNGFKSVLNSYTNPGRNVWM